MNHHSPCAFPDLPLLQVSACGGANRTKYQGRDDVLVMFFDGGTICWCLHYISDNICACFCSREVAAAGVRAIFISTGMPMLLQAWASIC